MGQESREEYYKHGDLILPLEKGEGQGTTEEFKDEFNGDDTLTSSLENREGNGTTMNSATAVEIKNSQTEMNNSHLEMKTDIIELKELVKVLLSKSKSE